jgi:hypothetical protein
MDAEKKVANGPEDTAKPFGLEYLEELPVVPPGYGTGSTPPTSACTGLQTGGGDDPLKESECD